MQKIKIIMIIIIIIAVFSSNFVYADDEAEDYIFSKEELDEILETMTTPEEIPSINSRHAIVYERTSRKNFVWKKRK